MEEFDIVIRNGTIVDGTGALGYRADLGLACGWIRTIRPAVLSRSAGRKPTQRIFSYAPNSSTLIHIPKSPSCLTRDWSRPFARVSPLPFPERIHYVLINGEMVVDDNRQTEKHPGKVRRQRCSRNI
jgi:hypothetical protein